MLPKISKTEQLLLALRLYLDSRAERFLADAELMDSAGKCAIFYEINSKLCDLERWAMPPAAVVCKVVENYGRFLFEYRARRPEKWAARDLNDIRVIYQLYDDLSGLAGSRLELEGTMEEQTRAYNIMASMQLHFQIRPALGAILPGNCDWVIVISHEDYQRYQFHLNITGNGHQC